MRVALAGNPNSGKTTLFNVLTGANQYVGNWPGVTVERKRGKLKENKSIEIMDLPGIYSLSPYTPEEIVARNYLVNEQPDVILNIVDGSNLERNLYLTTQLLEIGVPVIVAVNMMDVVHKRGDTINTAELEKELGCVVVEISALKNKGIKEVVNCLNAVSSSQIPRTILFSSEVEEGLKAIQGRISSSVPNHLRRFYSIKLLEKDTKIKELLPDAPDVTDIIERVETACDDDTESVITNDRYTYITSIIDACRTQKDARAESISDKIDRVVTNRVLALPIFALVMVLVYYLSVSTVGTAWTNWANDGLFGDGWYITGGEEFEDLQGEYDVATEDVAAFEDAAVAAGLDPESDNFLALAESEGIVGTYDAYDDETGESEIIEVDAATYAVSSDLLAAYSEDGPDPAKYGVWVPGIPVLIENGLDAIGCADWLKSLILDGIVAGVGTVLGFVPQMLVLFLLLAFLEGCGYMSRIAFILDRIFRRFGLSGKSFIPILIGTGCGVPGVMASRTIENQNDRRMTVMTTTFIPCSAKLPIIALIAGAIFGGAWWVAPSAYFLGIAAILCSGIILKKTRFFAGDPAPFVMELPAYHLPTVGSVLRSMWERAWSFIKKAGTIILLATILIYFISGYGFVDGTFGAVEDQNDSLLAMLGGAICWIFSPLGWGDWQAVSATVTGLIAKENVISTFGILYAGDAGWYANVQAAFTPIAAYSFLTFNLLCAPCFAAMGAIKREMNNIKWFFAAIGYQCGLAWCVACVIFQIGGLVTGEVGFNFFTMVAIGLIAAFIYLLFRPNKYHDGKLVSASKNDVAIDAA